MLLVGSRARAPRAAPASAEGGRPRQGGDDVRPAAACPSAAHWPCSSARMPAPLWTLDCPVQSCLCVLSEGGCDARLAKAVWLTLL